MNKYFPKELFVVWAVLSVLHLAIIDLFMTILMLITPKKYRTIPRKNIFGQVVLITGGGSGLGRLLALECSKLSVVLVILDRSKEFLQNTKELLGKDAKVFLYECDVSDPHRVYEVAQQIKSEVGKVDILVNNAGVVSGKRLLDLDDDAIRRTMNINALAHFWMCKAFLPEMMATNSGHIVSIASVAGVSGLPNLTDYCASKFAAVGLMESLRLELDAQGLHGVKLTTICPSLISTGLFEGTKPPLTVLMTPEFVVDEIMKAILEEKEFIILPRWMYIIILLKWTMPKKAVKRFYENSGLLHFMDSFKGRSPAIGNNSNLDKRK